MKGSRKVALSVVVVVALLVAAFLFSLTRPLEPAKGWYIATTETSETGRFITEGPAGQFDFQGRWQLEPKESEFHGSYDLDIPANAALTLTFRGDARYNVQVRGVTEKPLNCDTAFPGGPRESKDSRGDAVVIVAGEECRFEVTIHIPSHIFWELTPYNKPFDLEFIASMETG